MVTIHEVAAEAGVSISTVSRTLAGSTSVNPELATRVRASAQRLGYRSNRVARALRRQATQTVGLVVPDLTNPFFPAVVQAVEKALRQADFSLLLCDAGDDVALEADLLRNLFDRQIDGLLISVCDRIASRQAVQLAASRVPLVQIDRRAVGDMPYVGVDQASAMGAILDHLVEQGCRRFAYITPHPAISTAAERLEAFLRRARALDETAGPRVYRGDFSVGWGHEATTRLLRDGPLPDAIVCADDLIAIGAMQALREHRVEVPRDVLVTGFDDTVLAIASDPQLTTVRQPLEALGREAVTMLWESIGDRNLSPRSTRLEGRLVVRGSSQREPS